MLLLCLIILLFVPGEFVSLREQRRQIIEQVRDRLREGPRFRTFSNTDWLENSNKIGFGYNLLAGSPICYTGQCQMDEFTHSIFNLSYTSPKVGSCTNKLVPDNIELDCLSSTSEAIESEIIDSIEQLYTSISNKVGISLGAKFKNIGFSYGFSKETQHMIDSIVKNNQISLLTTVKISTAKLSMFEPKMELSDNFRYVIETLFCCEENDPETEEYIKEFIFDYFGLAYVTDILLGGLAQQNIFINKEAKQRLEQQAIQIQHQAKILFDLSMGTNISQMTELGFTATDETKNINYNSFVKEVTSSYKTTLGGDSYLNSFSEWSKTVTNNPVIINFKIKDIFRLLTKPRFPNDPLITNKSALIEKTLENYLKGTMYCYNNCSGNGIHGTCEPTGYFHFGVCKCDPGWTGFDCGTQVVEQPKILQGTICGFDRSFIRVNCGGLRPWEGCPSGWSQYNWPTDLTICYKTQTTNGTPVYGTLCGLHSYSTQYNFNLNVGCGSTSSILTNTCPVDYQHCEGKVDSCYSLGYLGQSCTVAKRNIVCAANNIEEELAGTLCGMQIEDSIKGPSCNGYDPGLRRCPPGYSLHRTAFNEYGFMVCVKN